MRASEKRSRPTGVILVRDVAGMSLTSPFARGSFGTTQEHQRLKSFVSMVKTLALGLDDDGLSRAHIALMGNRYGLWTRGRAGDAIENTTSKTVRLFCLAPSGLRAVVEPPGQGLILPQSR